MEWQTLSIHMVHTFIRAKSVTQANRCGAESGDDTPSRSVEKDGK